MWKNGLVCFSLALWMISAAMAWAAPSTPKLEMMLVDDNTVSKDDQAPASNLDYLREVAKILFVKDIQVSWVDPAVISKGVVVAAKKTQPRVEDSSVIFVEFWDTTVVELDQLIWSEVEHTYKVPFTSHLTINYRNSNFCGAEVEALASIEFFLGTGDQRSAVAILSYGIDVEELSKYGQAGQLEQVPTLSACYE